MRVFALTTTDNKFDPLSDFDKWLAEDERLGYFTNSYLARIAKTSNAFSDEDYDMFLESAMDEIISLHPNLYKKVAKEI